MTTIYISNEIALTPITKLSSVLPTVPISLQFLPNVLFMFTGKGPLQTTLAVITSAKKISEAGTKLDKLARQIADQCPESSTKKDLLAYLQRIALYCHQLNITSKVKADVQNVSGELIVSGLDSATSLIQAAKNLMNAVVLTVKASYVASTKYPRQALAEGINSKPVVVWKMKV